MRRVVTVLIVGFTVALITNACVTNAYLTLRYSDEFFEPVKQAADLGCPVAYPESITVYEYHENYARIWIVGEDDRAYRATLNRKSNQSGWQMIEEKPNGRSVCNFEIVTRGDRL